MSERFESVAAAVDAAVPDEEETPMVCTTADCDGSPVARWSPGDDAVALLCVRCVMCLGIHEGTVDLASALRQVRVVVDSRSVHAIAASTAGRTYEQMEVL